MGQQWQPCYSWDLRKQATADTKSHRTGMLEGRTGGYFTQLEYAIRELTSELCGLSRREIV